jgi:hypothetical protein
MLTTAQLVTLVATLSLMVGGAVTGYQGATGLVEAVLERRRPSILPFFVENAALLVAMLGAVFRFPEAGRIAVLLLAASMLLRDGKADVIDWRIEALSLSCAALGMATPLAYYGYVLAPYYLALWFPALVS